jgi:hypothetical protein
MRRKGGQASRRAVGPSKSVRKQEYSDDCSEASHGNLLSTSRKLLSLGFP